MNIVIYYLTKKITISEVVLFTNSPHACIDTLNKKDFLKYFETFAESNETELHLVTSDLTNGFEEFKKCFKFIYAAGGLIQKDNNYLFIYRLKRWDLPKGKFEMGETPEECAIRECEEECGITQLSIIKPLPHTLHIYNHKGSYALKHTYWFAMSTTHTTQLVPQIEESIERVEWFNIAQIKETVLANSYPAIKDVIRHLV